MTMRRILTVVALLGATTSVALARTGGPSLRDRQQAACYNDAQRLCGEFVPDVDKITVCMQAKKDQVSHKCHKMMKATE